jgi:TBC1 domain family member 25
LSCQKNEKGADEEWRKFSVDPQITSLEVLYSILAKAFEIKSDFGISYKTINPNTKADEQLIIYSDWDLDAAFLR